jgi:N-acetylglucosamine kinase-like BadF-type ATPase
MRFVLGFDGGGTKTECVLMDETGEVLASTRSGPSNPSRVGLEASLASLIQAADNALAASGKSAIHVGSIHGGIAGIGATNAIPDLVLKLKLSFPNAGVRLDTDLNMALAATQQIPSVVVIAGTGSAAIGRDSPNHLVREGGLGPILGDPGSAYDIGRKAVSMSLRHWLRAEKSTLGDDILSVFGCDWTDLQSRIRLHADNIFPNVYPIVVNAAAQGSESARALLGEAAEELSNLAVSVIQSLKLQEQSFFLAKVGGVFGRSCFLDDGFDASVRKTAPQARIGPLPVPVAVFAARKAIEWLGTSVRTGGN